MKIAILVLSYNEMPFSGLMQAQQMTWDSIIHDDVTTYYYFGKGSSQMSEEVVNVSNVNRKSIMLQYGCTDAYYYMAAKFKRCLGTVLLSEYDMIFRTNSSSYVNKERLLQFAEKLPREKLYAGWTFQDTNHDGGKCVSGAGMFLSIDCAKILRDEIDTQKEIEEDVYVGRILRAKGIEAIDDKSRIDYPQQAWKDLKRAYHIRFKTDDRAQDGRNMLDVHEKTIR